MSQKQTRNHPRHVFPMPIQIDAGGRTLAAECVNVGLGGALLRCPEAIAFGACITLRFRLPTLEQDSVVEAVVRWFDDQGVGVQFQSLRARDVWALNQLFLRLTAA